MNNSTDHIQPTGGKAESRRISRQELLDFIIYLQEKKDVVIESRKEYRRTMFNTYPYNVRMQAEEELRKIKEAASAEAVYCALAAEKAKLNCSWKHFREFAYICEEDLIEYLTALDFSEEEAEKMATAIESRRFRGSVWEKDPRLTEEFRNWASAGVPLQTRSYLPDLFRLEYLEFRHRGTVSPDTSFLVSDHSVRGAYNGYGYILHRLIGQSPDKLILSYTDNYHKLDREQLIPLAELLCRETGMPEAWIHNTESETVTVVKQKKATESIDAGNCVPAGDMVTVGKVPGTEWSVGIYPNDRVMPHFHMINGKTGKALAVSLDAHQYYRSNPGETELLTPEETAALCRWLGQPSHVYEDAGIDMSNYRNLCILWNQCTAGNHIPAHVGMPDYSVITEL